MNNPIYLDYAATTPVLQCAKDVVNKYMTTFYNPSAAYAGAREVRADIENARSVIAKCIGADPEEIFFTSGATEGNNIIIKSLMNNPFLRFVTSDIEHHSVLNLAKAISGTYFLHADYTGHVDPNDLVGAIDKNDLVSVMMVNNEIGTIQPIKELAVITKKCGAYMHSDLTQAVGHIPIDVHDFGIDCATASGHKFGAPKGVGFMYIRKGLHIDSFIYGGGQEHGVRPGTENVPGIIAMASALQYMTDNLDKNLRHIHTINNYLCDKLNNSGFYFTYNYTNDRHYDGNCNVCFMNQRGEEIVEFLSANGIYVSSGSACTTNDEEPSHVLKAIGLTDDQAEASIRISISEQTTKEEIDRLIEVLRMYFSLRRSDNFD